MEEIINARIFCWLAPVAICVAIVAYFVRNRLVFVLGIFGLLLGFLVPEPVVYADYSSGEAAYLAAVYGRVSHVVAWSASGAIGGTLCGCLLVLRTRRKATADLSDDAEKDEV